MTLQSFWTLFDPSLPLLSTRQVAPCRYELPERVDTIDDEPLDGSPVSDALSTL